VADYGTQLRGTIQRLLDEHRAAADTTDTPAPPPVVVEPAPIDPVALHERDWRCFKAGMARRDRAEYHPFARAWERR